MILWDRIHSTKITIDELELPIEFGRYFVQSNESSIINGNNNLSYSFLVPAKDLTAIVEKDKIKSKKKFIGNILLSKEKPLLNNTLLEIKEDISKNGIKNISALYRNIDDKLEITNKDRFIKDNLYHIEEICRDPAYKLDREIVKVPTARAKRIPVGAINYLASHTEDWSRRRLSGVEPKQIKSEVFHYNLKIYENQMTAILIYKLIDYCNKRLQETNDTEEYLLEIEKIIESRKNNQAWYKKLDRDYKKLGNAVEIARNSNEPLKKIKKFISDIQSRLYSLLSTELYKTNKTNNFTKLNIKRTNLLDNHKHYRVLVRYWDKTFEKNEKTNMQKSQENDELCNSFIEFGWLLTYRSIIQMGFSIVSKNQNKIEFSSKNLGINLKIRKTDIQNIELECNNKVIQFVALPDITNKNYNLSENTYLLVLDNNQKDSTNLIKVSPAKINSEERITKVIFQMILKEYINNYFLRLDISILSRNELNIIIKWISNEQDLFTIENKMSILIKNSILYKQEQNFLSEIKSQKNQLSLDNKIRVQQLEVIEEIRSKLLATRNHFQKYYTCISCGSILNQDMVLINYHDNFEYQCQNSSCGIHYGLKKVNDEKQYFYHVKNHQEIISKNESIEDAFGYEYLESTDINISNIKEENINRS